MRHNHVNANAFQKVEAKLQNQQAPVLSAALRATACEKAPPGGKWLSSARDIPESALVNACLDSRSSRHVVSCVTSFRQTQGGM